MRPRVAVTGMGLVTPVGSTADEAWCCVEAARPASGPITAFDRSLLDVSLACEVRDFRPQDTLSREEARRLPRVAQFALVAAAQAVADSGLVAEADASRRAVSVGTCLGAVAEIEEQGRKAGQSAFARVSPLLAPMAIPNAIPAAIAMRFGWSGPNLCISTACAAGAHAIGEGLTLIRDGRADVVVAGGAEAMITPLSVAAFLRVGTLSMAAVEGVASRPFDAARDGFVLGEGAAFLVLERLDYAVRRQAKLYGEVLGYAANADAYHQSDPHPDGLGAAACMRLALADAGVGPERVAMVNAHGTGTRANDLAEARAIADVLGARTVPVTSNKGVTGHMIGASGAFEAAMSLLALRAGRASPTAGLEKLDDEIADLIEVVTQETHADLRDGVAVSNSFAMGGQNAALVLSGPPS